MSLTTTLLLAFSAGMAAAINPCGFALLPAYLSYYLGIESREGDDEFERNSLPRAFAVSGSMTLGFVLVFGIIGAVWSAVSGAIGHRLPWVIVVVGLALVGLGIAMVFGYVPVVRLPSLATTSGSQSAWSAFVFGVSYGVASLSCAMPLFIGTVITTFGSDSWATGVGSLLMYGVGMGAIITALTLAVTFARKGLIRSMRRLLPHMGRISGVLLILSGLLAAYYGTYEARILSTGTADNAFAEMISRWQSSVTGWMARVGEERIGIAVAIVAVATLAIAGVLRRPRIEAVDPAGGVGAEHPD